MPLIRQIIAAIAFVVVAVVAYFAPYLIPALISIAVKAAVSGFMIGGAIGGLAALATGGSVWNGIIEGAVYGAIDAAALAIVVFGIVTAVKAAVAAVKAANAVRAARTVDIGNNVNAQVAAVEPANPDLYKVGPYNEIKGAPGLDAHHVGQKAVMKEFIPGYDPNTAPAINVPAKGHTRLSDAGLRVSTKTSGFSNARQVIARDIMQLRMVYPDIPNSALQELINLNKIMYGL